MSPFLLRRLSDEQLGSRLALGEAAAFDELYRRYVNRLAAYGAHLLGDAAAGDDVAQSTLLKAYGALRDGRVPRKMKPWLYRIAHNTAIDLVARRRELPSADLPERPSPSGEPQAGALIAALAALPDRQRRVYVLRELHGLRIDETAHELSLTAAQVEQSLFAARNRLAELLVFGDRLDCLAVRKLAAGPLDGDERRALKTHLRSCPGCRNEVALPARATWLFPDWLRGLLAGGGAPVAAKLGAVVASATVATGVPITVEHTNHRELPQRHVAHVTAARRPAAVQHVAAVSPAVQRTVQRVARTGPVEHRGEQPHATRHDDGREVVTEPISHEGRDGSGGGGEMAAPAPTTTTAPATTTTAATTTTTTTEEQPTTTTTTTTTTFADSSHDGGGGGTDGGTSGGMDGGTSGGTDGGTSGGLDGHH